MVRGLMIVATVAASIACVGVIAPAAGPEPAVSLLLQKASAERWEKEIFFRCDLALENDTGRELAVRSHFFLAFDGLELVVTALEGKVLSQPGYTFHQSPFSFEGGSSR